MAAALLAALVAALLAAMLMAELLMAMVRQRCLLATLLPPWTSMAVLCLPWRRDSHASPAWQTRREWRVVCCGLVPES